MFLNNLQNSQENTCVGACFEINLEAVGHRFSSKWLFFKIWQIWQERTCVGVVFNKVAALRTVSLLKRDSCETCEVFKNTLFYWISPVVASDSFRFPVCNFIKKRGFSKDVFLWILQNFLERFLTEHLRMTAS